VYAKEETHSMKLNQKTLFSTRNLVMMAVLTALQIILARYLSLQVSPTLRISFETIPVALAGMWLGPLSGAIMAFVSDLLGTIIYGYGTYFPPLCLGPVTMAVICGLCTKYIFKSSLSQLQDAWKVIAMMLVTGSLNSLLIGCATSTLYAMIIVGKEGTFPALFAINFTERLVTKPLLIIACAAVVCAVNQAAYRPVVQKIVGRPV